MAGTKGNQNAKKAITLDARVIVLMTKAEKRRAKAKAKRAGKHLSPYGRELFNDS